jgi:hypothetical protein
VTDRNERLGRHALSLFQPKDVPVDGNPTVAAEKIRELFLATARDVEVIDGHERVVLPRFLKRPGSCARRARQRRCFPGARRRRDGVQADVRRESPARH